MPEGSHCKTIIDSRADGTEMALFLLTWHIDHFGHKSFSAYIA